MIQNVLILTFKLKNIFINLIRFRLLNFWCLSPANFCGTYSESEDSSSSPRSSKNQIIINLNPG